MKHLLSLLFLLCTSEGVLQAQCNSNQAKIKVILRTDQYPAENSWQILSPTNAVLAQSPASMSSSAYYYDSICVDTGFCYFFKISDTYGDGICCSYGQGFIQVFYNDSLVLWDSSFGYTSFVYMGCPNGQNCSSATAVSTGTYTAPVPNTWYSFVPPADGFYNISNCGLGNFCNTKIWLYYYCNNLVFDTSQMGTIYYANDNCDTIHESFNAFLLGGYTYYIRIGDEQNSCGGDSIHWSITQNTAISGCMDTAACNFNPFATISVPSSCLYYPSPLCPTGPDLKVDSSVLASSISIDTFTSTDACSIREGCINGYDLRQLIRFSTKIESIGATDFYAGIPPLNTSAYSPIFHWDACHGHWHYTDYAEYLLADSLNNFIPIGYKNGFCVEDYSCTTGFPKFGCVLMGITTGCSDEYLSGLPCQWIDITNVADGNYKLIVRANWVPRPDFYGRYEVSYFNNWARACIKIYHDSSNVRKVQVFPSCAPYYDCMGVENGLAVKDCADSCNGTRLTGDINLDHSRNNTDLTDYMLGAIYYNLPATKCTDLNNDQKITVTDAALLWDCALHGPGATPPGHTHQSCVFPNMIKNPDQHDTFSITQIDTTFKVIEISISNPDNKIMGYQIKMKGVTLSNVQDLMPLSLNYQYQFSPSGGVIGLSLTESPIDKHSNQTPLIRLFYSSIDSPQVCIDSVIAVVNDAYEEVIQATAANYQCMSAIPTTAVSSLQMGSIAHTLFPNPFSGTTTLAITNSMKDFYTINLYDIYGRLLRTYSKQNSNAIIIEKGNLFPGIYYISAQSNSWQFREKLLIE